MSNTMNDRFVAQIVLEAETALRVGSGQSDLFLDAPVMRDWNGLPMILGTSIAGVLRATFAQENEKEIVAEIFGEKNGSRLFVSNAHLLDADQRVHQTLGIDEEDDFLKRYGNLPVREHVAIGHNGTAKKHAKFDEEVVYAGSRFKCELELIGSSEDEERWFRLLSLLTSPLFRLGGGSTKGFGKMKVVSCLHKQYVVGEDYDTKPSDLNVVAGETYTPTRSEQPLRYLVTLKADDFFSFGSGFGDDQVDDIPVREERVVWKEGRGAFSEREALLPASSLKGALSHRLAFYYNVMKDVSVDTLPREDFEQHIGENNRAVATLFGVSKGSGQEERHFGKGRLLFSDIYRELKREKIFDHVKIDRFTGGASESALYNEKVLVEENPWQIEIVLREKIEDKEIINAFAKTLDDLCLGRLPLGGKVNRGHGIFKGVPASEGGVGQRGWRKGERDEK